jgi:hypothetical protein
MTDALLLMGIQNGVVGRFGAGDDYLDRVVAAHATAEAVGIPVILARVRLCPGYPEVSPHNAVFSAIRSSGRTRRRDCRDQPNPFLFRRIHAYRLLPPFWRIVDID